MSKSSSLSLADALCARVNCRNIGAWLRRLARELELQPTDLMPAPPLKRHEVLVPTHGLRLVLRHPHGGETAAGDPDRWVISDLQFGLAGQFGADWGAALPFGLQALTETPATAADKLDGETTELSKRDLAAGDFRQSYFLNHALVVELLWQPSLQGLTRVSVARLGSELLEPAPL